MTQASIINEMNFSDEHEKHKKRKTDVSTDVKYVFLVWQSFVAIVLLIAVLVFKTFGGRFFLYAREKYSATFERSLNVQTVVNTVKTVYINLTEKDEAKETNIVNTVVALGETDYISDDEYGFEAAGVSVDNTLLWPAKGRISSKFGLRLDPFTKKNVANHKGIDIAVPSGTSVKASLDGKVNISRYDATYGNYIVITHSQGIKTLYAHLDKRFASEGDSIKQGDVIALSGNTGNSTGPHLHFEILMGGTTRVDPLMLLPDEE